jgi:hypothetical protein
MRNAPDRRGFEADARVPRRRAARNTTWSLLVAAMLATGPAGCTTAQMSEPPSVEALERIPAGTRLRVTTRAGETLRLTVTDASPGVLAGRDRYFRRYELPREDIASIEAPAQSDWWVALLFVAVVFVAGT